jgi:hypothetical protein
LYWRDLLRPSSRAIDQGAINSAPKYERDSTLSGTAQQFLRNVIRSVFLMPVRFAIAETCMGFDNAKQNMCIFGFRLISQPG